MPSSQTSPPLRLAGRGIAQVVVQIVRQMAGGQPMARQLARGPVLAGLAAGFAVMYLTGMMVG